VPAARVERAPAKVNLTLRVLGRRPDGYHDIESLVVFAAVGDTLTFAAGRSLALTVRGPTAVAAGDGEGNLVLKAARALGERVPGLKLGRFVLGKRLPVAAGLGGGSSDAAATLRLLARANRIALDDPRLMEAARACGADVPVCLDPRARVMCGIGEILSDPIDLPRLAAVLVNPGVAVPTKQVFAALRLALSSPLPHSPSSTGYGGGEKKQLREPLLAALADDRNDLETPAIVLAPVIADVLDALRAAPGCRLARMSGSGATCFGLFDSTRAAASAARALRARHPGWWVRATSFTG
jgi:4-diphosphocytidyl-2-C-methyl-D-erythritol kinase